jgi:hypothetical protein
MSLRAPLAVVVEIRADERRWFRLSRNVGSDGIGLERAVPIEIGRPVQVWITLPLARAGAPVAGAATPGDATVADDAEGRLSLRAEVIGEGPQSSDDAGGDELAFIDPPYDARQTLKRYVKERLGLHLR